MRKLLVLFALSILTLKAYCQDDDWILMNWSKCTIWIKIVPDAYSNDFKNYKVWVKSIPLKSDLEKERNKYIYLVKGKPNYKYKNYSHTLTLYEYSCSENIVTRLSVIDYNTNGEPLYSSDFYDRSDIIPNTLGEQIADIVCMNAKD